MQQINLYRFLKQSTPSPLTARMLLLIYGLFMLFLMSYYFYSLSQKNSQLLKVAQLTQNLNQARQHFVELVERYPQLNLQPQATNTNKACQGKYSSYLTGFANTVVPGVWLTEFAISMDGTHFSLKGHAIESEQVQQYLTQLNHQSEWAGLTFVLEELKKPQDNTNLLNFSIASEASSAHS